MHVWEDAQMGDFPPTPFFPILDGFHPPLKFTIFFFFSFFSVCVAGERFLL